ALILAPIQVDDKLAGLLEIFLTPDHERQNKRFLTRLTTQLAGFVGTFWQQRQWRQQQDQQQIWPQLEAFAAQVHRSLALRHVAPAFGTALALQRLPLQWLARPLAQFQGGLQSRTRLGVFVGVMVLFALLLVLVPLPQRPEVNGRLVPQERRILYATVSGKV